MLAYRRRGLAQIHVAISTLAVVVCFLLLAKLIPLIRQLDLDPSVNLPLFALVILLGMLAGGRFVTACGQRITALTWRGAAALSLRQITVVALAIFALVVGMKVLGVSRLLLAFFLLVSYCVLVVMNHALPRRMSTTMFNGAYQCRTLFVGPARRLEALRDWITGQRKFGMVPVGLLSDDYDGGETWGAGGHLGPIASLARVLEERSVNQVVMLDAPAVGENLHDIFLHCQDSGCRLMLFDSLAENLPQHLTPVVDGRYLLLTMGAEPLEDPFNRTIKRSFDLILAIPAALLVLPAATVIVALVQLLQSRGPIFVTERRAGRYREPFMMLRFRTTRKDTPDKCYPFGAFLDRTGLDELPQLWNVLANDMSLVGPRPHLCTEDETFAEMARAYRSRHTIKPGLTGLAQVSGLRGIIRGPELLQKRVDADLNYIAHWSPWLDIKILFRTPLQLVARPTSKPAPAIKDQGQLRRLDAR